MIIQLPIVRKSNHLSLYMRTRVCEKVTMGFHHLCTHKKHSPNQCTFYSHSVHNMKRSITDLTSHYLPTNHHVLSTFPHFPNSSSHSSLGFLQDGLQDTNQTESLFCLTPPNVNTETLAYATALAYYQTRWENS